MERLPGQRLAWLVTRSLLLSIQRIVPMAPTLRMELQSVSSVRGVRGGPLRLTDRNHWDLRRVEMGIFRKTNTIRNSVRIFPVLTGLVVAVLLGSVNVASSVEPTEYSDGNLLLRAAMQQTGRTKLTARVRQSGELLGQSLVGSGIYAQTLDASGELLTRWQMDSQFETKPGSLLQIHTGSFLWLQRRVGDEKHLSRIDVRRVLSELGRRGRGGDGDTDAINRVGATLVGGMPGLLASLLEHFQFNAPKSAELREIGTYELTGEPRRKPVPAFAPTSVQLVIGRDDLLPYSIVYVHAPDDAKEFVQGELRTEFYEVAIDAEMDPSSYRFVWDGQEFVDDTAAMTQRLRLMQP